MVDDPKRRTISDIHIDGRRRLTVTPLPSDLKVPDSDTFTEQEGTPIVNKEELAWREIGQMSKHLRGLVRATNNQAEYVKQIPEIKSDVKAVRFAAKEAKEAAAKANQTIEVVHTKLGTQMDNIDRRVGKVEDRGHDCAQVAIITELRESSLETRRKVETDIQEGVKTRERLDNTRNDLEAVDKEVKSFSTARRNFFLSLIGVGVFLISTVGSLIWFLSSLDAQVGHEQRERQESYNRLEQQLTKMGKVADTQPVQEKLSNLTKAVRASNGHETTEAYCAGLSDRAVNTIKRSLPRNEWPRCRRFGFEPVRSSE